MLGHMCGVIYIGFTPFQHFRLKVGWMGHSGTRPGRHPWAETITLGIKFRAPIKSIHNRESVPADACGLLGLQIAGEFIIEWVAT